MRNINVVKYRKLLYNLQYFCKENKLHLWQKYISPKKRCLTDYERGWIVGQHAAYNEVLRKIESMMVSAEYDWNGVHCREEKNNN